MLAKGTGRHMRIPGRCMRIACIKIDSTRDSLFQKRKYICIQISLEVME